MMCKCKLSVSNDEYSASNISATLNFRLFELRQHLRMSVDLQLNEPVETLREYYRGNCTG